MYFMTLVVPFSVLVVLTRVTLQEVPLTECEFDILSFTVFCGTYHSSTVL